MSKPTVDELISLLSRLLSQQKEAEILSLQAKEKCELYDSYWESPPYKEDGSSHSSEEYEDLMDKLRKEEVAARKQYDLAHAALLATKAEALAAIAVHTKP